MNKGLIIGLSILAIVVIIFGSLIGSYNQLQQLDESVNSNWAQIENQLQRNRN